MFAVVRDWVRMSDGRDWLVYAIDTGSNWSLRCVETFPSGKVADEAEELASGSGQIGGNSRLSEDGKLIYNTLVLGGTIYQIPINSRGEKSGSADRLPLPEELNCHSPAISRDGFWMMHTQSNPGEPNRCLLRDMRNGSERLLHDNVSGIGSETNAISPDGSMFIVGRTDAQGERLDAFLAAAGGIESTKLCERCAIRGISSNNSVVLAEKYALPGEGEDKIVALNLSSKTGTDAIRDSGHPVYEAFFSPDDHWVAFERRLLGASQIFVAPFQNGKALGPDKWIPVTDGRYSDTKPRFTPGGNAIYFLSSRDSHTCVWIQKLNPKNKRPIGEPIPFEHFHANSFDFFRQNHTYLSVAKDKLIVGMSHLTSDLWINR
ncbi:MAG TPA: hypothetical protein VN633_20325 [Bryobacteraceae bacterium]|nr:hypothetical protein [Bryobacteraceae bacterium]